MGRCQKIHQSYTVKLEKRREGGHDIFVDIFPGYVTGAKKESWYLDSNTSQ